MEVAPEFIDWVSDALNDNEISQFSLIQNLWSGYGQCFRFYSPKNKTSLVAKAVKPSTIPTHPKGWISAHSHHRKLTSYLVETHFYKYHSTRLTIHVPTLIHAWADDNTMLLIMSDLNSQGFDQRKNTLNVDEAKHVLIYLARFHATFLSTSDNESGLWDRGTYWQLSTRQDEWNAMPDSELKHYAQLLHDTLAQSPYQTIVHGDAKVANFCFRPDSHAVAAVDFQYAGAGVGVQDVAYFLGSALNTRDQLTHTGQCLDVYFNALYEALNHSSVDRDHLESCWRALYPVACADFKRFLTGWSPDHWKLNQVLDRYSEAGIKYVKSKAAR